MMAVVIDILHCLYLGVAQAWIAYAICGMINADVWGVGFGPKSAERRSLSCLRFRDALLAWYANRRVVFPGIDVYAIQEFTPEMIFKKGKPCLRAKGAETKHLLLATTDILRPFAAIVSRGDQLFQAGLALREYVESLDSYDLHVPTHAVQETRI